MPDIVKPVVEEFQMHPRLLWDVITRQAGSISKAMLEGAMNLIDAGATRGDVTLNARGFTIKDDGKGMTVDEIRSNFKVFGQPHQAGDAEYGRYRMGRGQMFSFGRNVWKTGQNIVTVDLKPQMNDPTNKDYKLGFEITQGTKSVKGCHISVDFYDDLAPRDLAAAVDEFSKQVRYVAIPVYLNGKQVSQPPETEKWDEETAYGYFKKEGRSNLVVYNKGIFVCHIPTYEIGVSGIFVSKPALEVNFARNQVVSSCKTWKKAQSIFADYREQKKDERATLSDGDRENICRRIANGTEDISIVLSLSILRTVTGGNISFINLTKKLDQVGRKVVIAPCGDRSGEMADQMKYAVVLSFDTLERFGVGSWPEFKEILLASINIFMKSIENNRVYGRLPHPEYCSVSALSESLKRTKEISLGELTQTFNSVYTPLKDSQLTFKQAIMLKALRGVQRPIYGAVQAKPRDIFAGKSTTAQAWTDGHSSIWVNVNLLDRSQKGFDGVSSLLSVLLHEYLHNSADNNSHIHDDDFYHRFHDMTIDSGLIGFSSELFIKEVGRLLSRENGSARYRGKAFRAFNEVALATGLGDFIDKDATEPDMAAAHAQQAPD